MDKLVNSTRPRTIAELQGMVGGIVGVSSWITVDQQRIDAFADVTEDHQFLHVDPVAAAAGPFGGTIAHGFLSLSLLVRMADSALPPVDGMSAMVNYGFDRVRFLTPVPSGASIRGVFTLENITPRHRGQTLFEYAVEVEIRDNPRPALSATWLLLIIHDGEEDLQDS